MRLFKLIDAEKANYYPISVLCRVLRVSRSGYYDWKDRPTSKRDRENTPLTEEIRAIHDRSRQIYGYPRVHAGLTALGVRCSRKQVARLMRKAGLRGCRRGRKKRTTRRNKHATTCPRPRRPQLLCRLTQPGLDGGDITYIHTQEGFVYLAFILDVYYSRKVVGWSMALTTCGQNLW